MKILNLTQHVATAEQITEGVFEPGDENKELIKKLLTFSSLPTEEEIIERADHLAAIAYEYRGTRNVSYAMIGGAPYLMGTLESSLLSRGVIPVYSFTERCSIEEILADGSVKKTAVFKHVGFVTP